MSSAKDVTLIVLQHGLWGNKGHMKYIGNAIKTRLDSKSIEILNVDINEASYTYDGIDILGKRLAIVIQEHVKRLARRNRNVKRVVLIGYSLGGLMLRYAIGILGENGFFDTIEPFLFVTFATPHLGVRREPTSTFAKMFNFVTGRMLSRTGEQLQLLDKHEDGRPLLNILADPDREFYRHLSRFKKRRVYANTVNDRTVPFWTAALESKHYFRTLKDVQLSLDTEYSSVITAYDIRDAKQHKSNRKPRSASEIAIRYIIYALFPILLPIFIPLAATYIGSQSIISRIRVSRLLKDNKPIDLSKDSSLFEEDHDESTMHEIRENVNDTLLVGALDATNLGETDVKETKDETKDLSLTYNVPPSETLSIQVQTMQLCSNQMEIQKNLKQLHWEKVLVYISGFNAHASIVCREKRFVNDGGRAVIQHFVDSLSIDL